MGLPEAIVRSPFQTIASLTTGVWPRHPAIVTAYLFGSLARENPTPLSDVDLAILLADGTQVDELAVLADVTDALGTDALDLVVLNRVGPILAHRVLRDGRELFCRDEMARITFTRTRLLEYFDTEPLRRAAERSIQRWIRGQRAHG